MTEFLFGAAFLLLLLTGLGLLRLLRQPSDIDRILLAQLIGTGGIAILLLIGAASDEPAAIDVALTFALLAALASIAFVKAADSGKKNSGDEQ